MAWQKLDSVLCIKFLIALEMLITLNQNFVVTIVFVPQISALNFSQIWVCVWKLKQFLSTVQKEKNQQFFFKGLIACISRMFERDFFMFEMWPPLSTYIKIWYYSDKTSLSNICMKITTLFFLSIYSQCCARWVFLSHNIHIQRSYK